MNFVLLFIQVATRPDVQLRVQCLEPSPISDSSVQSTNGNSGKSKAIFFIHGVAGSSDVWTSQLKHFVDRGFHVIAPDLLGHGFSSTPDKSRLYTFKWLCNDCVTVFDETCKEINVVVGHSYG